MSHVMTTIQIRDVQPGMTVGINGRPWYKVLAIEPADDPTHEPDNNEWDLRVKYPDGGIDFRTVPDQVVEVIEIEEVSRIAVPPAANRPEATGAPSPAAASRTAPNPTK